MSNIDIWTCPHASKTDWGSCSCKLYDPYEIDPKKQFVKFGVCKSNNDCIYKEKLELEKKNKELKAYIKFLMSL